jgi:hypothetical protein
VNADAEIAELKEQMERLNEEVADLRKSGVRGSKTEAMMALQYDSLPDFYKSSKVVAIYKKIQTSLFFIIPVAFLAFAIKIGSLVWQDHQGQELWDHLDKIVITTPH